MVPSPAQVRAQLRRPTATYTIIAINVAVFLYQQTLSGRAADQFLLNWSLIPARFTHAAEFSQAIVQIWPWGFRANQSAHPDARHKCFCTVG